jgi:DNA-directed RNA polymerase specialized sigma24 family protein
MKKDWVLTQEAFERLLEWLDTDRHQAAIKYEAIHLRLVKIFTCRGCAEAEDLADETFNRVTTKISDLAGRSVDPLRYILGFIDNIQHEYFRRTQVQREFVPETAASDCAIEPAAITDSDSEAEYQCLETCLEHLSSERRDLVVRYYQHEQSGKIEHRKKLAHELGIALNALRIRAHRIRLSLHQCVKDCLEKQPAH